MVARAVAAPFVIGVDLGGTSTRAALVDREGTIHARHEFETPESSEEDVLAALDTAVERLLDSRVVALGYGVPSNLARGTRRILRSTNLPLDDVDLVAHAAARFGLPVGIENDANAAALAEWKLGAGRGVSNLLMLTLGTGVGGGLVLDGRLYRGWVELGHARKSVELAREGTEIEVKGTGPLVHAVPGPSSTASTSAAAELSTRG